MLAFYYFFFKSIISTYYEKGQVYGIFCFELQSLYFTMLKKTNDICVYLKVPLSTGFLICETGWVVPTLQDCYECELRPSSRCCQQDPWLSCFLVMHSLQFPQGQGLRVFWKSIWNVYLLWLWLFYLVIYLLCPWNEDQIMQIFRSVLIYHRGLIEYFFFFKHVS